MKKPQIKFIDGDFNKSFTLLEQALNEYSPTEEEIHDFEHTIAIFYHSDNEIKKSEKLYKIIQAKDYGLLTPEESEKFVLDDEILN